MRSALSGLTRKLRSYFGKTANESRPVLQHDVDAIRLADVQRRIRIYLYALWGIDFDIAALNGDPAGNRPYLHKRIIHLPGYIRDFKAGGASPVTGMEYYRAAAAHAAAQIVYGEGHFQDTTPDKWQKAVISAIEDARIETLSIRKFPGLKQLWLAQHTASERQHDDACDYLDRLSRALLDETYTDPDPWIAEARELFGNANNLESSKTSWDIGMALAQSFSDRKIRFGNRPAGAPYRDDNRHLWEAPETDSIKAQDLPTALLDFKLLLGNNEFSAKSDDAKPVSDKKPKIMTRASHTFVYPEWDFRSQTETPAWATVRETAARPGDLKIVDDILAQNAHLIQRMKSLLQAILYNGARRVRKLEEGDEIDINAAIRALIDIRQGVQPDTRIMMRSTRKTRDISVLVLLDLSNSTNQKINGQEQTVLQLARQICVLFADVIETVGDPFAIHGFCSKSRHNVEYFRFKDFDQPYDDVSKARISGMTGQRATRMGAAIRHAHHYLDQQPSHKKLLMCITDGEPDDVDVRGDQYLRFDAKMAVNAAARSGIQTYCLGLDPDADQYVSQIFGARNYMVLDHVKCLPEKMLMIYTALTR